MRVLGGGQGGLVEGDDRLTPTLTLSLTLTLTLTLYPLHSTPTQVLICTSLEPRNAVESVQALRFGGACSRVEMRAGRWELISPISPLYLPTAPYISATSPYISAISPRPARAG